MKRYYGIHVDTLKVGFFAWEARWQAAQKPRLDLEIGGHSA